MGTVDARISLHCPKRLVLAYLSEGLSAAAPGNPKRLVLRSHLPATHIELAKGVDIECEVEGDFSWRVRWKPEEGGMYPAFTGRLSVGDDPQDGLTILHLRGEYEAPLGEAGVVFDKAFGHRMAHDTAAEFLMDLAGTMRARYAFEQAKALYGSR
ncbi:MAG TPA: hypothetical protein VFN49_08285 [Candidatus Aquilonibacter sp.]|nr:hypothetical protein [Candidatus Aquilonibacter sp.]